MWYVQAPPYRAAGAEMFNVTKKESTAWSGFSQERLSRRSSLTDPGALAENVSSLTPPAPTIPPPCRAGTYSSFTALRYCDVSPVCYQR